MAFGFLKKNKPDNAAKSDASGNGADKNGGGAVAAPGGDAAGDGGEDVGGFKRDLRKAKRWFEHAAGVADHDFAIECYIHGLEHDPDNMPQHEALREAALRRKVAGGKPAGFKEKMTGSGKHPVQKMLHAEKIWAKDPLDAGLMLSVMERAVAADEGEDHLQLGEVAYWAGKMILQTHQPAKPLPLSMLVKVRDLFSKIGSYTEAIEASKMALNLDMNSPQLLQELKNLEAEETIRKAGYTADGSFRDKIKDADKQKDLEQSDAMAKTESVVEQVISRRRAEFNESPEDVDRMSKLVDALMQRESDDADNEAVRLLTEAYTRLGMYRYKESAGKVRMRQFNRQLRVLKPIAAASAENSEDRKVFNELAQKKLAFELEEYAERVKNYPTDMSYKYELGKRLYQVKKIDEAITMLQQSKADPKVRALSCELLGQCFLQQGWIDEAIQTFQSGLEANPDEKRELELQYLKMGALEQSAAKTRDFDQANEAQKLASQIMQANISFRDIRKHMDHLRKLIDEIQKEKRGGG